MNRMLLILILFLAVSTPAFSQPGKSKTKKTNAQEQAASTRKIEEEIIALEKMVQAARLRNDKVTYRRYQADDFFGTASNGVARERNPNNPNTNDINVTPGGDKYEANDLDDIRVKVYGGDTAVITYRRSVKARSKDGTLRDIQLRETVVRVKQNGEWKAVAAQTTAIAAPQPQ
ncbi:MAG TPA: nuclear transport factor 2 family protein [Blastocatellia bacterium]|nr:nuclear transport factor 2 family protein [Blastocatellia bacterium]